MEIRSNDITKRVTEPEQVPVAFDANFNAGDIDGVIGLFSDNATMRMPDGATVVTGIEELHRQLSGLLKGSVRIHNKVRLSLVSGDVALVLLDWTLTRRLADGQHADECGTATQVMARGGDGFWKLRISNPLGTR